jgi:hypothetical protein
MKPHSKRAIGLGGVGLVFGLVALWPLLVSAQWPFGSPTTPDAQRNALNAVRSQVNWLQNATRTAPSYYGPQGYGTVWQQFQTLRAAYNGLKQTLNPQQVSQGANDFAELDAGLDIIQEAFANYQEAVSAGQPVNSALRDMCQVLGQASRVWLQELNKRCSRLRVGWG